MPPMSRARDPCARQRVLLTRMLQNRMARAQGYSQAHGKQLHVRDPFGPWKVPSHASLELDWSSATRQVRSFVVSLLCIYSILRCAALHKTRLFGWAVCSVCYAG